MAKNGSTTIFPSAENHGSVLDAIDAFEPSIERETVTVPRKTRQNYPPARLLISKLPGEGIKFIFGLTYNNIIELIEKPKSIYECLIENGI